MIMVNIFVIIKFYTCKGMTGSIHEIKIDDKSLTIISQKLGIFSLYSQTLTHIHFREHLLELSNTVKDRVVVRVSEYRVIGREVNSN